MDTNKIKQLVAIAILGFLLIIGGGQDCHGQSDTSSINLEDRTIESPTTPAQFPGGEREMYCFIDRNLDKDLLRSVDTTGTAWARFTVDRDGQVTKIHIRRSLTEAVDNELIRVIGLMPEWSPGKLWNAAVGSWYNLPLKIPYENKHCH